jgi:hypothetical protein
MAGASKCIFKVYPLKVPISITYKDFQNRLGPKNGFNRFFLSNPVRYRHLLVTSDEEEAHFVKAFMNL